MTRGSSVMCRSDKRRSAQDFSHTRSVLTLVDLGPSPRRVRRAPGGAIAYGTPGLYPAATTRNASGLAPP
jgi:hypothetical protein